MVNRVPDTGSSASYNPVKKGTVENPKELFVSVDTQPEQSSQTKESSDQDYLSNEKAKKMTDSLNKLLETTSTKLRYEFHEELEEYYVTLVDTKTDEVVREIPNKKLMDMYAAMLEFVGVFVDKKI